MKLSRERQESSDLGIKDWIGVFWNNEMYYLLGYNLHYIVVAHLVALQ